MGQGGPRLGPSLCHQGTLMRLAILLPQRREVAKVWGKGSITTLSLTIKARVAPAGGAGSMLTHE